MITGIRRRKIAEEGSGSIFQTSKLIISHFRRAADKKKIFELSEEENNLKNLLVASCAVHIYHYLGIHTMDTIESGNVSVSKVGSVEKMEKDHIYSEIISLVNDAIGHEIDLLYDENMLLSKLLQFILDAEDKMNDKEIEAFRIDLEDKLTEMLQRYPYVYFFDYVGSLLGYEDDIRDEIIEESSNLKILSQELEKELLEEGQTDQYIELSLLKRLKNRLMGEFEFSNKKELQMETLPIKMISNRILRFLFNGFPTSRRALEQNKAALEFERTFIERFKDSNETKTNYEVFEMEMFQLITDQIRGIVNEQTSNDMIYFLQFLMGKDFHDVVRMFQRFGVTDIPTFCDVLKIDTKKIFRILKMYGISKMDLRRIANPYNSPLIKAETALFKLKSSHDEYKELTLEILCKKSDQHQEVLNTVADEVNLKGQKLVELYRKREIVQGKLLNNPEINSLNTLIFLAEQEEILKNLSREIYYTFFSRITRQISRLLETYIKTKEDISKFLLGLKRIKSAGLSDDWVKVKIEELMIKRLMERQRELSIIFEAETEPFIVNGFILARLVESTLQECEKALKEEPSAIYFGVKELTLPKNLISPVSYCLAFELLERFKEFKEKRTLHVESAAIKEKKKISKKKTAIREAQEKNTLNWIDRKVSSSIMRVSSKGINPTALYWSEKDNQTCTDNMKLHSELKKGTVVSRFAEYYEFALNTMQKNWSKMKVPPSEKINALVLKLIQDELLKRLGSLPSEDEIDEKIIEGDRWNIASQLSAKIGKKLDKVLYKKFKLSLRKQ